MGDDTSTSGPATRLVKIKDRKRFWIFIFAFSASILLCSLLYFYWDSSPLQNIKKTFSEVFGSRESVPVEIIDLNDDINNSSTGTFKQKTLTADENDTPLLDVESAVDFTGLKIASVIFDVDGSDEGQERVLITNTTGRDIRIDTGSIQYLQSGADFSKIKKRNFDEGNIVAAGSSFIIGMNCHETTPCVGADLSWSDALNNTSGSIFIVSNKEKIIGIGDTNIISRFDYGSN